MPVIYAIKKATADNPRARATWEARGGRVVVICPGCGLEAGLDHDVDAAGRVTPSLDCPRCSFHAYVRLEGWDLGPRPRTVGGG